MDDSSGGGKRRASRGDSGGGSKGVCSSKECKKAADNVLETMDPSANPCEDFYRFACGKFLDEGKIPKGSSKLEMLTPMNKRLMNKGRELLDERYKVDAGDENATATKAKLFLLCPTQVLFHRASLVCKRATGLPSSSPAITSTPA